MGIIKESKANSAAQDASRAAREGRTVFLYRFNVPATSSGWSGPISGAAEVIEAIERHGWQLNDFAFDRAQSQNGAVLLLFRRRPPQPPVPEPQPQAKIAPGPQPAPSQNGYQRQAPRRRYHEPPEPDGYPAPAPGYDGEPSRPPQPSPRVTAPWPQGPAPSGRHAGLPHEPRQQGR